MECVAAPGDSRLTYRTRDLAEEIFGPDDGPFLNTRLRICRRGEIVCARCDRLVPRSHTLAGACFDFRERKVGHNRCSTHLFLNRGIGDLFVLVVALSSSMDEERRLTLPEPQAAP